MLTLSAAQVRSLLDTNDLRAALLEGYAAVSRGEADVPARIGARTRAGLLGAMPGHVRGVGLAAKLVTVFPSNPTRGLPSHMAVVVLFDPDTGTPMALMDGEVITEMRTSASAAAACELLAPEDVEILTIVGAGVQGAGHLEALAPVRRWKEIRIANRTPERAIALARHSPLAVAVADIDDAVDGADVVACTTDADGPVFDHRRFAGRHLSSVGIHAELPRELVAAGSVFVQERSAVSTPPPSGPAELQGLEPGSVTELGEVVAGTRPGRTDPAQLTVWKAVGHAMEDVVAAGLVYDRAVAAGVGGHLEL